MCCFVVFFVIELKVYLFILPFILGHFFTHVLLLLNARKLKNWKLTWKEIDHYTAINMRWGIGLLQKIRRHDNNEESAGFVFLCSIFLLVACWCLHKTFQCQQLYDESKSRALHIISIFHSPLNIFPHDRMFSIGCWLFCLCCCVVSYLRWMEKTTLDGWVHWWVKRAGRKEQRQKIPKKKQFIHPFMLHDCVHDSSITCHMWRIKKPK